jgi:hypothetical protein
MKKILSFQCLSTSLLSSGRELYRAKQLYHSLETTNLQLLFFHPKRSIIQENILNRETQQERENTEKKLVWLPFFY